MPEPGRRTQGNSGEGKGRAPSEVLCCVAAGLRASNGRPLPEDALIPGLPSGKICVHSETGLYLNAQAGVVVEYQFKAVVAGIGGELDVFYDLACSFGEVD